VEKGGLSAASPTTLARAGNVILDSWIETGAIVGRLLDDK
jgi:hypothetical protein